MIIETGVSLWAAMRARGPALLAFGGDSAIELLSAAVVLWRFRKHVSDDEADRHAARIAGILLLVLTAFVVAIAFLTLLGYSESRPSYLGIAVLCMAAAVAPPLSLRILQGQGGYCDFPNPFLALMQSRIPPPSRKEREKGGATARVDFGKDWASTPIHIRT